MSWNGLKKAVDRATTQIMVKTGHIDQTIDSQFDYEEKRYRLLESNTIKLQKLLKTYHENIKTMKLTELNMSETLKSFYGDTKDHEAKIHHDESLKETFESLSHLYHKTLKDLNGETLKELDLPYNQTILNPIARFNSYFPDINEVIKKRNNKLLDYDMMKNKVRKIVEAPSSSTIENLTTLNQELQEIENTFTQLNDQLKTELPKFVNLRIPFLNPTFESFVKIQLKFFNDNFEQLNNLQNNVDAESRMLYEQGKLDEKMDNILNKMRALDIAGS